MSGEKIGIYGGTFDPLHIGHLNLAIEIMEKRNLDEIWFCPVWINPHKLDQQPTPVEHRLAMLRLALADVPHSRLIDIETKRHAPSFTVNTLKELQKEAPDKQFCLIMGDDAIPGFFRWHQPEVIVKLAPVFIGRRLPESPSIEALNGDPLICEAIKRGMTATRMLEISGTEIRKRLAAGHYCGHLLPAKIIDYISEHHLYSNHQ